MSNTYFIQSVVSGTAGYGVSAVKLAGHAAYSGTGMVVGAGYNATAKVGTVALGAAGATVGAAVGVACKVPGVERVGQLILSI